MERTILAARGSCDFVTSADLEYRLGDFFHVVTETLTWPYFPHLENEIVQFISKRFKILC